MQAKRVFFSGLFSLPIALLYPSLLANILSFASVLVSQSAITIVIMADSYFLVLLLMCKNVGLPFAVRTRNGKESAEQAVMGRTRFFCYLFS